MRRLALSIAILTLALLPAVAMASVEISARCGGNGGSGRLLSCPAGQYVVAITARGASYVDKFGIRCAAFNSSGKRGALGAWRMGGSSGGSTTASATCGGNQAVLGITVRSGWYIDRVSGGECGARIASGGFDEFDPGLSGSDLALSVGGSGGSQCDLQCPAGEAIGAVVVYSGSWVDRIGIECRP